MQTKPITTSIIKREGYSPLNRPCQHVTSCQIPQKIQTFLSVSSTSSPSVCKANPSCVGVSGTWFPPVSTPVLLRTLSSICTQSQATTSHTLTTVPSDTGALRGSLHCTTEAQSRTVSTVVKQNTNAAKAASTQDRNSNLKNVLPKTTETKTDHSCSPRMPRDVLTDVVSHESVESRGVLQDSIGGPVQTVSVAKQAAYAQADVMPGSKTIPKESGNVLRGVLLKESERKPDRRDSSQVQEDVSSDLTSQESGGSSSVQFTHEFTRTVPTGAKQVIPASVVVTSGKTAVGNSLKNILQKEEGTESAKPSPPHIQENFLSDLTTQATHIFQQVFSQTVGSLSTLFGEKKRTEGDLHTVSLQQTAVGAESSISGRYLSLFL